MDVLSDGLLVSTDVLSRWTFWPYGRFVHGRFVSGRFVSGRFVWAPLRRSDVHSEVLESLVHDSVQPIKKTN